MIKKNISLKKENWLLGKRIRKKRNWQGKLHRKHNSDCGRNSQERNKAAPVGEGMLIDCGGQGGRNFLTSEMWRMLRRAATVTSGFRSGIFSASVWLL